MLPFVKDLIEANDRRMLMQRCKRMFICALNRLPHRILTKGMIRCRKQVNSCRAQRF